MDEKSQIQALDRTQPGLPLRQGRHRTQTHDYKRHGTTALFAALNTLDDTVLSSCQSRHRHQKWLRFLKQIDAQTPTDRELHLIVDNYATHKHAKVKAWLAKHPLRKTSHHLRRHGHYRMHRYLAHGLSFISETRPRAQESMAPRSATDEYTSRDWCAAPLLRTTQHEERLLLSARCIMCGGAGCADTPQVNGRCGPKKRGACFPSRRNRPAP